MSIDAVKQPARTRGQKTTRPAPAPKNNSNSLRWSSCVRVFAASHPRDAVDPVGARHLDKFVHRAKAFRELYDNTTASSCSHQRPRGQLPNLVRGHSAANFPWRFPVRVVIGVVRWITRKRTCGNLVRFCLSKVETLLIPCLLCISQG